MTTRRTLKQILRTGAVCGAVATLVVVTLQTPASAYGRVDIPGGYGHASVNDANDVLFGCDDEANGIGVYGRFLMFGYPNSPIDVPDSDGSSGGCGVDDWRGTGYWVYQLQAIQRDGKVSPWGFTY